MKHASLLVTGLVVLGLVACSSGSSGTGTSGGGGGSGLFGSNGGTGASGGTGLGGIQGNGGSATCDDACAHYLGCKGQDNQANRSQCVQSCSSLNATPADLANFVATSCDVAICTIEGGAGCGGSSGTSGSTSGGTSGGTDCNGCAWDGSSACIYLTGSGGNYFPCAMSCCPGH